MRWLGWPQLALPLLILAASCRPTSAGGEEKWWCDKDDQEDCFMADYSFVETCILIVLVCMALVFEFVYHHVLHHVAESYHYGHLHLGPGAGAHGHGSGRSGAKYLHEEYTIPLWKHWFSRLCGEMMVLGYIAFCVFVAREAGFFYVLENWFPAGTASIHLPPTAYDWLHMVELVHMKLFLGMLIYFMIVSRIVSGSVQTMRAWEEMRIMRVGGGSRQNTMAQRIPSLENTAIKKYGRWRTYFIVHVLEWKTKRPLLFQEMLKALKLDQNERVSKRVVKKAIDENFVFSAYLAYSVCSCTTDTVDVHTSTWICVIFLLLVFAMLHRFAKVVLLHLSPVFIVAAFAVLGTLGLLVRMFRTRVEESGRLALDVSARSPDEFQVETGTIHDAPPVLLTTEDSPRRGAAMSREPSQVSRLESQPAGAGRLRSGSDASASPVNLRVGWTAQMSRSTFGSVAHGEESKPEEEGFHVRHSTEIFTMRVLQAILFVLSYACARTLGDPTEWKKSPATVGLIISVFGVIFLVLGNMLPRLVPTFAALMAMPPYVDRDNAELFLTVLYEHGAVSEDDPEMTSIPTTHTGSEGEASAAPVVAVGSGGQRNDASGSGSGSLSPVRPALRRASLNRGSVRAVTAFSIAGNNRGHSDSASAQELANMELRQNAIAVQVEQIHKLLTQDAVSKDPPARLHLPGQPPDPLTLGRVAAPKGEPAPMRSSLASEDSILPVDASERRRPGNDLLMAQIAVLRRELERLESIVAGGEVEGTPGPDEAAAEKLPLLEGVGDGEPTARILPPGAPLDTGQASSPDGDRGMQSAS